MKKTKIARALFLVVALAMVCSFAFVACDTDPCKNGHTGGTATCTQKAVCEVCGEEYGELAAHTGGTATCTQKAVCTVCGQEYGQLAAHVDANGDLICDVCGQDSRTYIAEDGKNYTSYGYLAATPSNWNEMDYENANDVNIINYISSSFFTTDYPLIDESAGKFNADGTLNIENLDFEKYVLQYDAATKLTDVTAKYADDWGLTAEQVADGGYIWQITIRSDLCWDDGTPIKAEDFVYSMQEQLNYDLLPFRASTYWSENGMKIHNAQAYYYHGRTVQVDATNGTGIGVGEYTGWDSTQADGGLSKEVADKIVFSLEDGYVGQWIVSYYGSSYGSYISTYGMPWFIANMWMGTVEEGGYFDTDDDMDAFIATVEEMEGLTLTQIVADEAMSTALQDLLYGFWCTDPDEEFGFFTVPSTYPELSFDEVGIFAVGDYDIVVVLDQPEAWLKDDGSLSFSVSNCSLPLVKKDLYEACKQEPILGSSNWTTTYCTSLETTASWGPYKLTAFQTGKQYTLERNENWYGYYLEENRDQYLTDKYVVDVIETSEAQRMAFWAGQIDDIDFASLEGLASDYQNSDYAVFTPSGDGYAYGVQIFSDLSVLNQNGQNNSILAITDFRWALSLSFDRAVFNSDQMTGMELGLGLLGTDYCYDAETGETYRNSDQAKAALLRTYGFTQNENGTWTDGISTYSDIDEATEAMTGYNLALAKEKLALAIEELTSNPEKYNYDSSKDIILRLGKFNAKAERRQQLLQANIDKLVEGSILEGKIKVVIVETDASQSADEFRADKFDFYCVAAIGGAILYPFNAIGSYIGLGSVNYHDYVDPSLDYLTMTMPEGDYVGAGETLTLSVEDWFNSLNGNTDETACSYNWMEGKCPVEVRLEILAMLEEYALGQYHSIQVAYDSSAYLHSAKYHTITDTYNLFMGLGGSRYIRYDYTDEEWAEFVASYNNDLSVYYRTSGN